MNTEKTLVTPELNEGEIYAGAIINPDGTGHHITLLQGDYDDASWDEQMELAKSLGGDLPDRVEQALLFKRLPEQFKKEWYWSNTQHSSTSVYAWYQSFLSGYQTNTRLTSQLRARFVRRSVI